VPATELPFNRQAVAKHLAVLKRVGLVEARPQGREVHCTVRPERPDDAMRALRSVAAEWDRQLWTIKRIAESIHKVQSRAAGH